MKKYIIQFAILLIGLTSAQTIFADVKVKIRQSMSGQTYENTTYIKGKRQRSEQNMGGIQTVNLTHCDLRRTIQIMPASQTYLISTWEAAESVAPSTSVTKTQTPSQKGGVVTTTYTIKDTGERKQMFGYTARHLIITMETESSPDACTPMKSKMQTDGWYIDAEFALDCDYGFGGYSTQNGDKGGCRDRYVSKQIGTGKRGYPVYEKMTMFDASGKETYSFVNEVIELSKETLDASLFEIPASYREVKNSTELYSSMATQSAKSSTSDTPDNLPVGSDSGFKSSLENKTNQTASAANTELGEKKEGVIRIGLVGVKTAAVGEGIRPEELAGAIQNTLSQYLKTPQIEVVQLEARLESAVSAEAEQKECDFLIYTTAAHKKGGGMFGKVLGKMSETVAQTAYGSSNTAGHVTKVTIMSAAAVSANVKAKDEITLDIKVQKVEGGTPILTRQYKQKAKSDGEDIITAIIEQAAQAIVTATTIN